MTSTLALGSVNQVRGSHNNTAVSGHCPSPKVVIWRRARIIGRFLLIEFEFKWSFYALSASKAMMNYLMNEARRNLKVFFVFVLCSLSFVGIGS